ncbi:MAG: type II toxin-antitoxin system RelE/ParE family toxin [Chloroflexi bacterium]|nr:type II toxin-antitoxin system RelE/ParE family toxin [Chloroflexota bacterium]
MPWDIEGTDQFVEWYDTLSDRQAGAVDAAIDTLERRGPGLGRPLVDTPWTDLLPNLKELRIGTIRILFVFDPRRSAILLLGGDKAGAWKTWYDRMIPEAVRLYDEHLRELAAEGLLPRHDPPGVAGP